VIRLGIHHPIGRRNGNPIAFGFDADGGGDALRLRLEQNRGVVPNLGEAINYTNYTDGAAALQSAHKKPSLLIEIARSF
jgi:hypothetical protein